MQTNLQLVHIGPPAVQALGEDRSTRTGSTAASTRLASVATELRRGQVWEDCAWLLVAAASAGVLFISLTCMGRMW